MEEDTGSVGAGAGRRENGNESQLQSPPIQNKDGKILQASSRGRLGLLKGPVLAHPEFTWQLAASTVCSESQAPKNLAMAAAQLSSDAWQQQTLFISSHSCRLSVHSPAHLHSSR